jgi:hypothetical protein
MMASSEPVFELHTRNSWFWFCLLGGFFMPVAVLLATRFNEYTSLFLTIFVPVGAVLIILGLAFGRFVFRVTEQEIVFGNAWFPKRFARDRLVEFRSYSSSEHNLLSNKLLSTGERVRLAGRDKGVHRGVFMRFSDCEQPYVFFTRKPEIICEIL